MAERLRILIVLGTRPEAIKFFPIVKALAADAGLEVVVATTGQHREMVDQILGPFGIAPQHDLDIMRPDQSLNDIVCRVIPLLEDLYRTVEPSIVLVQGDTTSAFAATGISTSSFRERWKPSIASRLQRRRKSICIAATASTSAVATFAATTGRSFRDSPRRDTNIPTIATSSPTPMRSSWIADCVSAKSVTTDRCITSYSAPDKTDEHTDTSTSGSGCGCHIFLSASRITKPRKPPV